MKAIKVISLLSLIACILPSVLVFNNVVTLEDNKLIMIFGTIGWFLTSPFWMNKKI
ncbi:MAG: hypothetical protein IPH62_17215 [Ignavibacteriae bacterium]|nr:hypothetical protein [Ignavibacteriota bacterium]